MYGYLISLWFATFVAVSATVALAQTSEIVIDFDDAPLSEVVETLARQTGQRILMGEGITGQVTIALEDRVSREEALELLHAALLVSGNALVPGPAGVWKVLPLQTALGQAPWQPAATGRTSDRLVATMVTLQSARVEDLVAAIGQTDASGIVMPYPQTNSLILAMTEARLRGVLELVRALDRAAETHVRVLPVRHAGAAELETQIREALPPGDTNPRGDFRLRADERTNSLIAEGSRSVLDEIERVIATLDVPTAGRGVLHVVRVLNADAEALADKLLALEGDDAIVGEYQVFADPPTNSLVIKGAPNAFSSLMNVILELDRVPRQAEVDVTVLELTLTNEKVFSIDFLFPLAIPDEAGDPFAAGGIGSLSDLILGRAPTDGLQGRIARRPFLLPVGTLGEDQVIDLFVPEGAANIEADDRDVRVRSLMQPHLLAASGEEHRIFSGSQVPVPASAVDGTADAFTTSVNIERRDVGIDLRFTPTVHSDQLVELQLDLNVESVRGAATTAVGAGDEFGNFELSGTVRLVDGSVLVVGSAPQQALDDSERGVPYLRAIPILGWLFRSSRVEDQRRQVVVAVSARPVPTPAELRAESIRRRLAFERHLARTGPLRAADLAPYALLVATRALKDSATELAAGLASYEGDPRVHAWDLHGRTRFDVYLTGFESIGAAGRVALELREEGLHPALQFVGPLEP